MFRQPQIRPGAMQMRLPARHQRCTLSNCQARHVKQPPRTIARVVPAQVTIQEPEDEEDELSSSGPNFSDEEDVYRIAALSVLPACESVTINYGGGKTIVLQTGEIARQASGAVMAISGDTMVLATACASRERTGDGSFTPLTVNYAERFSAAGKTSGGFIKRDGRPNAVDTLTSRLVDRPLRPMIPKGWAYDTQVLEWVLSYDPDHNPQPLAITAASAALMLSDIPFPRAVAGVQVGLIPGSGFVVNPTFEQMKTSDLDLMMAGTADAVLMIEGFCDFLTNEQMVEAIAVGQAAISEICTQLQAWQPSTIATSLMQTFVLPSRTVARTLDHIDVESLLRHVPGAKAKRDDLITPVPWLRDVIAENSKTVMDDVYQIAHKQTRGQAVEAIRTVIVSAISEQYKEQGVTSAQVLAACKAFERETMRNLLLQRGVRPDGRAIDEVRPIASRCGVLPRTHGSSLFTRGETQALCVTTLGSEQAAQRGECMMLTWDDSIARFYLHYHFPPSSVGEVGRTGAPGRRELGHGMLAQRALAPVIPKAEAFPYVVRVESHITDSNGSSSMASVCGGCLALLDAGVPITRRVAGIAMGLVLEGDGKCIVLTDILGLEDALGDMDFKVAGDAEQLTAFQMDIKVEGVTLDIIRTALAEAQKGRVHILEEMAKCSPAPTQELSKWAPKIKMCTVPPQKLGQVIGPAGKVIKAIQEEFQVTVDLQNSGAVSVAGDTFEAVDRAIERILDVVTDLEVGTVLNDLEVIEIKEGVGAVVALPGGRDAFVHISELSIEPVPTVESVVKVGQVVAGVIISESAGKYKVSLADVKRTELGIDIPDRTRGRGGGGARGRGRGGRGDGRGGRGDGPGWREPRASFDDARPQSYGRDDGAENSYAYRERDMGVATLDRPMRGDGDGGRGGRGSGGARGGRGAGGRGRGRGGRSERESGGALAPDAQTYGG